MIGTISGEKFPESLNKFGGNLLVNKTVRGLRCWVWVSLVQRKPSAISRKYITRNERINLESLNLVKFSVRVLRRGKDDSHK